MGIELMPKKKREYLFSLEVILSNSFSAKIFNHLPILGGEQSTEENPPKISVFLFICLLKGSVCFCLKLFTFLKKKSCKKQHQCKNQWHKDTVLTDTGNPVGGASISAATLVPSSGTSLRVYVWQIACSFVHVYYHFSKMHVGLCTYEKTRIYHNLSSWHVTWFPFS